MKLYIAAGVALTLLGITEAVVNVPQMIKKCEEEFSDVTKTDLIEFFNESSSYESVDAAIYDVIGYIYCLLDKTGVWEDGKSFDEDAIEIWYDSTPELINKAVNIGVNCSSGANAEIEDDYERTLDYVQCAIDMWPQIFYETTYSIWPNASNE